MIQANDLRIGNYIDYAGEIVQVDGVRPPILKEKEYRVYFKDGRAKSDFLNYIPITEEWLLKFGFKPDSYSGSQGSISCYRKKINDFIGAYKHIELIGECSISVFYFQCNTKGVWNSGVVVESIHELQNLFFVLTGEELTVNEAT